MYKNLAAAVRRGDISEQQVDVSLRRLLIARFRLGDFDRDDLVEWTKIPASVVASKEHKQLALQAAREGIVLLKNNGVLPLREGAMDSQHSNKETADAKSVNGKSVNGKSVDGKSVDGKSVNSKSLVVVGPNANDSIMQWGNYSGYATKTVTVVEGLRRLLGDVPYVQGCGLTRSEVYESRFDRMLTPEGGRGMRAYYWNNREQQGQPAATVELKAPINLSNGGNTVFAPGIRLENFSARYLGTLIADRDETLTLRTGADDLVRVIVNGDTLVNIWKVRQRIQEAAPQLTVEKGKSYRIQIDYVQEGGMAAMQFDVCKKVTPTHQQVLAQIGDAETVVFVGGISPRVEGEEMKVSDPGFRGGDRTDIELPAVQRQLLRALHEAGKQVVFVNCSGGAMALVPELESCDAILQGWYGGELGGQAIAEVITGRVNPSGKLPMTFYRSVGDLPDFLDYTMKNRTYRYFRGEPLFPFGYGLSFTTFDIGAPSYNNNKVKLTVKNTGMVDGTEVVQVYIRNMADREGPLKTLRAYQRVALKAGETRTIAIDLPRDRFEGWDVKTNTMRVVPGKYELMVGTSSADKDLKKVIVSVK
jgi:beta-glucosidase